MQEAEDDYRSPPHPNPDNRGRHPKPEKGPFLRRSPDPEPLTSERMTLTMRKALDTSVVTCQERGKEVKREGRGWGVSPPPSHPLCSFPLPSPCPRWWQSGILPQSPTSAGAAAQRSPGVVQRSGRRPGPDRRGHQTIRGQRRPCPAAG